MITLRAGDCYLKLEIPTWAHRRQAWNAFANVPRLKRIRHILTCTLKTKADNLIIAKHSSCHVQGELLIIKGISTVNDLTKHSDYLRL